MSAVPITDRVFQQIADYSTQDLFAISENDSGLTTCAKTAGNTAKYIMVGIAGLISLACLPLFLAMDLCYSCCKSSSAQGEENPDRPISNEATRVGNGNNEEINRGEGGIIAFYLNQQRNDRGKTIQDIWNYDYTQLEDDHSFIQWMFPTDRPSNYNSTAPLVTEEIRRAFQTNETLKGGLLRSYEKMLDFYGFQRDPETGEVTRASNFDVRSRNWLRAGNHNLLRIDRIINSLALLSLHGEAECFYRALEDLYLNGRTELQHSLRNFWKPSILRHIPDLQTRV